MEQSINFQTSYGDFVENYMTSIVTIVLCTILVTIYWKCYKGRVSINGKTVFITGCDSGFGFALAEKLSTLNVYVIAACLTLESDGAQTLTKLGNVDVIRCDVTSDDDVTNARQFVERHIEQTENVLWGVVNNAGVGYLNLFELTPLETFKKIYEVNALGQVRVIKALVPFVRRCSGRIVNVASQIGRHSFPNLSCYCMSKFAVVAMSNTLRMELAQFGVKVSIIQPGPYRTNLTVSMVDDAELKWPTTPEHVKQAYGEDIVFGIFKKFRHHLKNDGRVNIYEVVDSMIHALLSKRPKNAYDCHWVTTLYDCYLKIMPERLMDKNKIARFLGGEAAGSKK